MKEEKERTGIRPAQVIAGALATVTAAFIGSQLGVYGTVIGAGLISLGSTVGSELYLRSIDRTKEAARRTKEVALARAAAFAPLRAAGREDEEREQPGPWPPHDPDAMQVLPRPQPTDPDATRVLPVPGREDDPESTMVISAGGDAEEEAQEHDEPWWRRVRWLRVLGGALAAFLIGMAVVTGIEMLTGNTLSGEKGRTISNVLGGGQSEEAPEQRQEQPVTPDDSEPEAPQAPSGQTGDSPGGQDQQAPQAPVPSQPEQQPQQPPASTEQPQPTTPPEAPPENEPEPDPGQNERPGAQQPMEGAR